MPLLAILIDAVTLGGYFIILNSGAARVPFWGLALQAAAAIVLLLMSIAYGGRRRLRFRGNEGYRPYTLRYGIVLMSFAVNAIVVVLYYLSLSGGNNLIMHFYG
ncbi:hypothetical protein [Schleiferilactobacillus harbinensis]|jgi:membrane protein implicated in regulation of membrane protease activity|uniref:hypothetical protein n=1 Tax=Schleiferilactobacillus harbinensis TaxID=304207 RepID=UPI0039E8A40F